MSSNGLLQFNKNDIEELQQLYYIIEKYLRTPKIKYFPKIHGTVEVHKTLFF